MKQLLIIFSLFFVTSCTTLNKEVNWFKQGEIAATRGELKLELPKLAEKHKEVPLTSEMYQQYEAGFLVGLDKFCDVNQAFNFAVKGINYGGQCDERPNFAQFQSEWNRGYDQFMFPE